MNKLGYLLLFFLVGAADQPPTRTIAFGEAVPMRAFNSARPASIRPVRWVVVGGRAVHEVVAGRTTPVTIRADIAPGWHIYSLTQKSGGPIPLRITLLAPEDVVVRGIIKAPQPEREFDQNFGIETELYSGSPLFTIPVGIPGSAQPGTRKIQVAVRYQVCSDKLCLPARTEKLDATLHIRGRG
ncbi:MAG: protein-disulfide reductase DsbD N-terminal domain-containing protein [Gemmatimonadaceae bacterium]